jgi:hypothetical protein
VPVIPYPNAVRALHQIGRHQIERGPAFWSGNTYRPLIEAEAIQAGLLSPVVPLSDWAQKLVDGLSSAARTAKRFEGLPGQRRPSDG